MTRPPQAAATPTAQALSLRVEAVSKSMATNGGRDMPDNNAGSDRRVAWAKSPNRSATVGSGWLSLIDHSIDVAAVAEGLLRLPIVRMRLSALAERELTEYDIERLCFLIGLHDAGKVNHGFQARLRGESFQRGHIAPLWRVLGQQLFGAENRMARKRIRKALRRHEWQHWFEDQDSERECWGVILAHHGSLPPTGSPIEPSLWSPRSEYDPLSALTALATAMTQMFPQAFEDNETQCLPSAPRFQHALAGLVTLADWLGSDDTVFRFPTEGAPSGSERVPWARRHSTDLLRRRGLDPSVPRGRAKQRRIDFSELFPDLHSPRPAQVALMEEPLPSPGQVTVLEAETGSGKTEAALIHFLRLFQAGKVDGLYFALPTRAAAIQIHRRVIKIVKRWLGDTAPPVGLAVPGYLRVDDTDGQRLTDEHRVLWPDDDLQDRGWAVENAKRYLSGALMVGTIDQLLMGGLRVRHAPFRSGPMLRLLLCVDEVHASDAYMTALLRNVLKQHKKAGGHVLLMSATLGSLARMRLLEGRVEAHQSPDLACATSAPYPSIQRSGETMQALPRDKACQKRVTVELVGPEAEQGCLLGRLKAAAEAGAVVLFIRNRVDDATDTLRRLEAIETPLLQCRDVTAPHHSRFAPEDRRLLDQALEQAFRDRNGVVAVTTQTAEQSLDIDADWLVTDIAPGDVLLQRIGRLHRHLRERPVGFQNARVTVLAPTAEQLAATLRPDGGRRRLLGLGSVYKNMVSVLATREWLIGHSEVRIPQDNRYLVEAATHQATLYDFAAKQLQDPWPDLLMDVDGKTAAHAGAALNVVMNWEEPLTENQPVDDLDAETRLGIKDRSVNLPQPLNGPFGEPVRTLNVPGWMAPQEDEAVVVTDVTERPGEIRFRLGSKTLVYSRFGLSPASTS